MITGLQKDLAVVADKELLPETTQYQITNFIGLNKHVLKKQVLALLFWDAHLDNIIVDSRGRMVGLIDFEHVDVVSIDFLLDIVRQMVRYPWFMLSPDMEKFADKEDYARVMEWYEESYPELFDFPDLNKRLDFYEMEAILRKLPRFPEAQQLRDRLEGLLGA